MKTLKFNHDLVESMLKGEKTTTWRMFDDKDISVGDRINCIDKENVESFATVEVLAVKMKALSDIEAADFDGHNKYMNQTEMLHWYQKYYGDEVTLETPLKIISFKLISQ